MPQYIKASLERSYAESFLRELEAGDNQYFFFVAKSTPWSDENNPPDYTDSVLSEFDVMNNLIALKKISPSEILYALPRYEWTSGTQYDQYTDTDELFSDSDPKIFYVVTEDNNLYKCMSNNGGARSTVKPNVVSTEEFTLSDGYTWKYLATLRESDLPYELTDYIPVDVALRSTDTDTTNQYNTQNSAVNGEITKISVSNAAGGSAGVYTYAIPSSPSASSPVTIEVAGWNPDTRVLSVASSSVSKFNAAYSSYYVGHAIRVNYSQVNPSQVNNYGIITNVAVGSNTVDITIADDLIPFTVTPTITGSFASVEIIPHVTVHGNGSGAYGFVTLNSSKNITAFTLVNRGANYTNVEAVVSSVKESNTVHPTLTATLSPKGGHGSNILKELNVKDIIIISEITEYDSDKFIGGGTYRQFGVMKNPVLSDGTGRVAGTEKTGYRDVVLKENYDIVIPETVISNLFVGGENNFVVGAESYTSGKINLLKSNKDVDDNITVKIESNSKSGRFISYEDRKDQFTLTLNTASGFSVGETVQQIIQENTVLPDGNVFAYELVAEGKILSIDFFSGKMNVQVTSQTPFLITSDTVGIGPITGVISEASANVLQTVSVLGEQVWVYQNTPQNVPVVGTYADISGTTTAPLFRVVSVGEQYYDADQIPSYRGLYVLHISTSVGGSTGGVDVTSAALTPSSFAVGDVVVQGVTGGYSRYGYGSVYNWDYVNPSYGRLYLTNVKGAFKSVSTHGLTGTTLGSYLVSDVDPPEVILTSGEILYIDNVRFIQRSKNQEEEFRIRLGF
jgi:hypothetical protein